jgi:lipid II:glycine glycyltransferase (peptidoglycan interpeptide bridge formation enzyme)
VIIRHYAGFYDPVNSPVIETSLMHLGFNITLCDINHHLKIKNSLFSDHINKMELRQLKKCIEAGLEVRQAKGNEAGKIYDIMTEFRTQKNIPITFSKDDFANSLEKMPENYTLFYVHDKQGEVIAATLMVRINDRVLYYFFPSDNPRRSSYSPMIMLMDGIFSYAKEHHYQYIDLGISSKNNTPQKGLIQFKENIGGLASVRLTFQLDIP